MSQDVGDARVVTSKAPYTLTQEFLRCPVTALAFFTSADARQYVLAGEDSWLRVYSAGSCRLRGQLRVFASQAIHGIQVSSAGLLLWGAQSVATVPAPALGALLSGDPVQQPVEAQAPDWIYDGSLSPYDPRSGVLINGHNEIVPLSLCKEGRAISFGDVVSPSRPALFSAAVTWTSPTCVLVAAGTVFGEIVVWQCHLDAGQPPRSEVLSVLIGHEGSIFGVAISPELELTRGSRTRLLASCSDDRTIRVWDITKDGDPARLFDEAYMKKSGEARETGFGPGPELDTTPTVGASRCLAVAMSHLSRIWHVKFACSPNRTGTLAGPVSLYSFGEDTMAQKWELHLDGDPLSARNENSIVNSSTRFLGLLNHVEKHHCHIGKHIWSAAVMTPAESPAVIATGGADGKITLIGIVQDDDATDSPDNNSSDQGRLADCHISLSYREVLESLPAGRNYLVSTGLQNKRNAKDGFVRYSFLSKDCLLASTLSGRILLGNLTTVPSWTEVEPPDAIREDLKAYTVMESPGPGSAFLGSRSGRLYLFREEQGIQELAVFPGKIWDLLCLARPGVVTHVPRTVESTLRSEYIYTVLVVVTGNPQPTLVTVTLAQESTNVDCAPLPNEKGIATAIGICGEFTVVGMRAGAIAIYTKTPDGFVRRTLWFDNKSGKDAVTAIVPIPPLDGQAATSFLTTCRDGKFRIYEIQGREDEVSLHLLHKTSPPLGPMLEEAWLSQTPDGDLDVIISGFSSARFVLWNETKQHEVAAVVCGGGHRTFDYIVDRKSPERMRFAYSKASQMAIYSQSHTPLRTLRPGNHGREIRSVAVRGGYLATGAEDTTIRIWEYERDGTPSDMRCHAVLTKHTTGIQCLKWFGEEYLLSSGGNEQLFVWRVTRPRSRYKNLAVVCEAVFSDRTPDGDLRITDFDVARMSEDDSGILVSLALSNSTLKTYHYTRENGFHLLAEGQYTGACLTHIRHLHLPGGAMGIITSSTDGHVAVWKRENNTSQDNTCGVSRYALAVAAKIHQSSIKCLDIRDDATERGISWQVITGGDDNALGVVNLTWIEDHDTFGVTSRVRAKDAHAASVTGAAILERAESFTLVATVSNDQRIKVWRVGGSPGGREEVALLENQYSAIADPGDLEPLTQGGLVIVGIGMEVWSWPARSVA